MAAVVTNEIRKDFGGVTAVDGVSLSVRDGEFLVLLGPSGCGKTTFLRIIAGLERQTSGDVLINDESCSVRGLAYGAIQGPLTFVPGTYDVKISVANSLAPCSNAPIVDSNVTLESGQNV